MNRPSSDMNYKLWYEWYDFPDFKVGCKDFINAVTENKNADILTTVELE